jgi:hypothetical protein
MTPQELQLMFGTEHAKVYQFADTVPAGEIPQVHITLKFADAISNNLIDCIVTELSNTWYVYTKNEHTISGGLFELAAELPLPEPEVVVPPEAVEPPAEPVQE